MSTASTLTLLALFHCLLLASATLLYGGYKTIANQIMALLLVSESFRLAAIFMFIQADHNPPDIIEYMMLSRIMLAPLLYMYTRTLTSAEYTVDLKQVLHVVPWVLTLMLVFWNNHTAAPIGRLQMTYLLAAITASTFIIYGLLALQRIRQYRSAIRENYADLSHHKLSWLKAAQIYLILIGCFNLLLATFHVAGYTALSTQQALTTSLVFTTLFCYLLSIMGIRYFRVIDKDGEKTAADTVANLQLVSADKKSKYKTGLTDQEVEHFLALLTNIMESEKPYLEHRLKLQDIGSALGLHPQQISQIINQGTGCHFHDYINKYRIEHALALIAENPESISRVNDLYEECGFSSQSTFYKHFKKVTGRTPKQFLSQTA